MNRCINVQVNPYLEFMNAILLTSKYNEMTAPFLGFKLMTDEDNEYTDAIKAFFKPYQNESIYELIESMIPNGFIFSRPVELMLSLGPSDNFEIYYPLSQLCIQYSGGLEQIKILLMALEDLEKKVDFFSFFDSIKTFYNPFIEKATKLLSTYPFIDLIEEQFGYQQNSYYYVISSLMRGNFGINFVDRKTGKLDMFSVFTTNELSLSAGVLFHEYSHPFINPLTDKYYDLVQTYDYAYEKLKKYKLPAFLSGYDDFKECVNEHFVRAIAIHLMKKINQKETADELLRDDLNSGYKFILGILKKLNYYDANRSTFLNFDQFYPELLEVFNQDI